MHCSILSHFYTLSPLPSKYKKSIYITYIIQTLVVWKSYSHICLEGTQEYAYFYQRED